MSTDKTPKKINKKKTPKVGKAVVRQVSKAGTQKVETEGLGIQGHPQLHSKFKVSLDYMRPCLKIFEKKKTL